MHLLKLGRQLAGGHAWKGHEQGDAENGETADKAFEVHLIDCCLAHRISWPYAATASLPSDMTETELL
ncbi:hypothetical protein [Sinorhizobium psoraleae]|uniref:Uncharacterized protein n=1 Tax=Sinorhizobium psoraleae TaxID=520838 RepID=A0ABT4KQK9_9HYPH|nr:hypothetical protein [Sinorhizobium psoraleae]MCZ4094222.1 hypothetical protein [Sinorhizobium psoraleae]